VAGAINVQLLAHRLAPIVGYCQETTLSAIDFRQSILSVVLMAVGVGVLVRRVPMAGDDD
jgi:hypothetical protein